MQSKDSEEMENIFKVLDQNNDGFIYKKDVLNLIKKEELSITNHQVEKVFLRLDPVEGNKIKYNQFC